MYIRPVYYMFDCYNLLFKNMKRHRKLLDRMEEMYELQQEPKGPVVTDFTNVVDTGLMDSIITKNIIECEDSDLIDRMSYRSGEISEFNAVEVSLTSKLDISMFSQFKGLSKGIMKEASEDVGVVLKTARQKLKDELSPIHKLAANEKEPQKIKLVMNKLNIKSIETIVNSIKAKYCKNKIELTKVGGKLRLVKPEGKASGNALNIKTVKGGVNKNALDINLKNVLRTLKGDGGISETERDRNIISGITTQRKPESAENQRNAKTPITLRRQPARKDSAGSVNGDVEVQGQKPIYNINFNLNLNLNVGNKGEDKQQGMSGVRPKVLSLNKHNGIMLTDRDSKSAEGKKPYIQGHGVVTNIKNLYYKQQPVTASGLRTDTIESSRGGADSSRSRSGDKYLKIDYSKGLIFNNSAVRTPRQPSRDILYLKEKLASASAGRTGRTGQTGQQETSYNSYFLKQGQSTSRDNSSRVTTGGMNSYTNTLSGIKHSSVIRKLKGDIQPTRINLNTKNRLDGVGGFLSSKREGSVSKERAKNKVFK
jgi:hypothetical protein